MPRFPERKWRKTLRKLERKIDALEARISDLEGQGQEATPPPPTSEAPKKLRIPGHLTSSPPPGHAPPLKPPPPLPPKLDLPPPIELPKPTPLKAREVFLTEEVEIDVPPSRERSDSLEVDLATRWLPRIGGILLLIGAAIGAAYIQPTLSATGRVAMGYMASVAILVLGWFTRNRSLIFSHTSIAIALALGYFVSFGSYFIEPMRVFPVFFPALILMVAFAGTLVILADRWQSQAFAGFGLLLGVLAALVSATDSQVFSLVALGVIALASGVLLVRREWTMLTAFAVVATYCSSLILWIFFPPTGIGETASHLGALVFYHLVFAAAFVRWSRPWLAREEAMLTAAREHALPDFPKVEGFPFSSSFAIVNSLALIGLSTILFRLVDGWWEHVGILFLALGALEGARLFVPRLNRGVLWTFHLLTSMGLLTGGVVANLSGLEMAVALALQVLLLNVAAAFAPSLRILKPLTLIPSLLVIVSIDAMLAGGTSHLGGAVTAVLILLSALPWAYLVGRTGGAGSGSRLLEVSEWVSSRLRTLFASGLLMLNIGVWLNDFHMNGPVMFLVAIALLLGVIVLHARAWIVGAYLFSLAAIAMYYDPEDWLTHQLFLSLILLLGLYGLWTQVMKGRQVTPSNGVLLLALFGFVLVTIGHLVPQTAAAHPIQGILILAIAGCFGVVSLVSRKFSLPGIRGKDGLDCSEDQPGNGLPILDLSLILAILLALVASVISMFYEALDSLLSAVVVALVILAVWMRTAATPIRPLVYLIGLATVLVGIVVFGRNMPWTTCLLVFIPVVGYFLLEGRRQIEARISLAIPPLALLLMGGGIMAHETFSLDQFLTAVGCSLVVLFHPVLYRRAERNGLLFGEEGQNNLFVGAMTLLVVAILLLLWTNDSPLPEALVTVAWGLTGFLVLGLGFLLRETVMRYLSIGVLVLTTGRIFLIDLAQAGMGTKIVAFLVTGVLFILAGMAYVFMKGRVGDQGRIDRVD